MKLFTKEIDKKLFQQYPYGNDLENQMVVAKIFNPYGRGVWYIINSDPNDPDYLWAIVDLLEVEVGSVSRTDLETIKVPPFRLNLERDSGFRPVNALELLRNVRQGKRYADGGISDVEVIEKDSKAYITSSGVSKDKPVILLEDGGNLDMLKNQAKEFKHHAEELSEVLKKNPKVHAWVVAKSERASSDLSDITHYLDGMTSEMANGGQLSIFEQGGNILAEDTVARVDDPAFSDLAQYGNGGRTKGGVYYPQSAQLDWYDIKTFDISEYGEEKAKEEAEKYIKGYIEYWKGELDRSDFKVRKGYGGKEYKGEIIVMRLFPKYSHGGLVSEGALVRVKKYGWIMRVDAIKDGMYYLENDKRGTMNGNAGSYSKDQIEPVMAKGGGISGLKTYEVEFTWNKSDESEFDSRKVMVKAENLEQAQKIAKEKYGKYYDGFEIVEVEKEEYDKYANGGGVSEKIYALSENMTDAQYEEKYSQLNKSQKDRVNRLISLGDTPKLALATVLLMKQQDSDSDTWNLYRYANGGGVGGLKTYEVEFTWNKSDESEFDSRKVMVKAENLEQAQKLAKEKYGKYYEGFEIVEVEKEEDDKYAKGGGVGFPPKGELKNKDNFLLKYEKKGNGYEFYIYKPVTKDVSSYEQIKYVCQNKDCPTKMSYNQFINYLYAETYLDDKTYAKGGGVGDGKWMRDNDAENGWYYYIESAKKVKTPYSIYTKKVIDIGDKKVIGYDVQGIVVDESGNPKGRSVKRFDTFEEAENYVQNWKKQIVGKKYGKGGRTTSPKKTTFESKVKSIKRKLLEGKKVPKAVQKDYGKTFSPAEAEDSAKRIVGAMRKKEMAKKK